MTTHADHPDYDHTALLYHSEREYVDSLVPFICEGLDSAQPVLVAVPGDKLSLLRDAMGDAAGYAKMIDITDIGRNPGRILAAELAFVDGRPDRHVRMVAEPVWAGRTAAEYHACLQHEALVNIAFAGCEVTGLCPYDASCLDESILADVSVTHPLVSEHGTQRCSPGFSIDGALDKCNQPLSTSPVAITYTVCEATDLAGARRCGTRYGRLLGMSADRIADLQLITTELATNSLDHGGGVCRLAFWHDAGQLVCEARDIGYLADPLSGRRPPVDGSGPYGLFVVNAIADLVRIHTSPSGTTIHAYLQLGRSPEEDS
ncbi:anti-sigma factor RsbA family regulatory protein [Mycobacterium sp.]|uniref:anti-sigma factor RsbA family regulatory protein n=1 Tax=Mycobacterium sp. TaxID=1785 RepID=UPI003D6ABDC0